MPPEARVVAEVVGHLVGLDVLLHPRFEVREHSALGKAEPGRALRIAKRAQVLVRVLAPHRVSMARDQRPRCTCLRVLIWRAGSGAWLRRERPLSIVANLVDLPESCL